ncbi:MAG: hypothetical protein Q4A01_10305 [Coriobacteriales bacterium]|nr:hypothetical protein [Coriobacteriales bacterium]
MEQEPRNLFRQQARDKLSDPDDLDEYLKVTKPSAWLMLLSVVMLLVGLLAWAIFGSFNTSLPATAVRLNNSVVCFLSQAEASKVHVGDQVAVGGEHTEVLSIDQVPMSVAEAREMLGNDYLVEELMPGKWGTKVTMADTPKLASGIPLGAKITIDHVAPITLFVPKDE